MLNGPAVLGMKVIAEMPNHFPKLPETLAEGTQFALGGPDLCPQ